MKTYVSHISALFFWRQRAVEHFAALPRSRKETLSDCCDNVRESNERIPVSEYFGPGEKHVLVPSAKYRVNAEEYRYHIWSGNLPPRALVELSSSLFVASPEFCFFLMATVLSVQGLVLLGLELCGVYRLQLGRKPEADCTPLTTPVKLENFVENCKGRKGYKKAKRALKWILAGSASPKESELYIRACLPQRLDGYAFPLPKPNGEMAFNRHQQELAERSTSYGDLYWPEQDVDVEYFGEDYHTGSDQMNRDAKRNNALMSRNTTFYTITWDIFDDIDKFDAIMREIARALHVRIRDNGDDLPFRSWKLSKDLKTQESLTHPGRGESQADGME